MPICKRDGFDNAFSKNRKNDTFHDNDEVFLCEITKEIFRDYEDYFRHVMIANSTVWQCEATGKDNLTYAEAAKSERQARKKMEQFKDCLRPAVMLVIDHAKQSSLNALSSLTFKFLRRRYFFNETVLTSGKKSRHKSYVVLEIIPPQNSLTENGVQDRLEEIQYKLQNVNDKNDIIIVPYENIRRQRFELTTDNLQMFIKNNVTRVEGILRPNPESYQKYVIDRKITFSTLFIGKMPYFAPAKIKNKIDKKQPSINKYLVKNDEELKKSEEYLQIQKIKAENAAAKAKSLKEEMERVRREKQEKLEKEKAEMERQKAEKKAKLLERIELECVELLIKDDDLNRKDQKVIPKFTPIRTGIPLKLLGDALMVYEFIHSFSDIISMTGNISFAELSRAFFEREVGGPLSDILTILLSTIFDLQKEEEEECSIDYLLLQSMFRTQEPHITMSAASRVHHFCDRHYSFRIWDLPIDPQTLSEILRLHLLSSGAIVREKTEKWRMLYRNGYSSSEDPGLYFRFNYPHILKALKLHAIYELPFIDIMRIVKCLMDQIFTYSGPLNLIEERSEKAHKVRIEIRNAALAESRRTIYVQSQKRQLNNEYNQNLIDENVKEHPEKKAQLEEKLNKKIGELMAQSDRDRKKFEQQLNNLNGDLFNYMLCLGMDRAYRKYYVLESLPGLFIEHPNECMDKCLENPPINAPPEILLSKGAVLPKNKRDLRAYLLKLYTEEEKQNLSKKNKPIQKSNDNKENKENIEQSIVNGLTNGYDPMLTNGVEKMETDETDKETDNKETDKEETDQTDSGNASTLSTDQPPTQYQLHMCTGDPHNCIVHDAKNKDKELWSFLSTKEEIEALIQSLNPLGERESQLRDQLNTFQEFIVRHVRKCPVDILCETNGNTVKKIRKRFLTETKRKYEKKINSGLPRTVEIDNVMYHTLVDWLLQFESDIYTGDLGTIKIHDRNKWRLDLENNEYDSQMKLQWGPSQQKLTIGEEEDISDDHEEDELDNKEGGKYFNKPFWDPGEKLGDTPNIDTDDSSDEDDIHLHDSEELRNRVQHLSSALLQIEQGIERRFFGEPFGNATPLKSAKDKETLEKKLKAGINRLKQWEISLMESTSYAQVFLHLSIIHDSIKWSSSTNKSLCLICRRGKDPEKMLLCDECNIGTHMFCMKPPMKTVPEGNWYCRRCVTLLGKVNTNESTKRGRPKRTFVVEEENENGSEVSSNASIKNESANRRSSGRRSTKKLKLHDIEEVLKENDDETDDDDVEEDSNESEVEENDSEDENIQDDDDAEEAEEADENDVIDSNSNISENEDETVCVVCSYDGCDLFCIRCKDNFHVECMNLKRPPRYNYICSACKVKDDRKRKHKSNDESSVDEEDRLTPEPQKKRTRSSRSSLRNNLSNGNISVNETLTPTNQRRSLRRTGDNLPLNGAALYDLLEDTMKHKLAWPFLRPVMQSEVPDYHKIIKEPMDLAKVKSKLNMGKYQINEEVMRDIQLIFNNCDRYNERGNEIYRAGRELEKFVCERCKELHLPFKWSELNG